MAPTGKRLSRRAVGRRKVYGDRRPSPGMPIPCDDCGDPVTDALARTVRLTVDRAEVDVQRLCPECFAGWIERYEMEMQTAGSLDADDEIIVD